MALTFDKIPSEIDLVKQLPPQPPVEQEINSLRDTLEHRTTRCRLIKRLHTKQKKEPHHLIYKFFCVCPHYNPDYCKVCKHSGNVIIDRDVLTKEEHLCFLATPKKNYQEPRKLPHYYQKKCLVPNCTTRIAELAEPSIPRVQYTIENFKNILKSNRLVKLKTHLVKKPEVQHTTIRMALNYIDEEKRLRRVAKIVQKRRCKRMKKNILKKQRKQIKKIVMVLFEEMKDFLLNDQFMIDEKSPLCAVILEKIRDFTDQEFYTTSNLREYQQILANNLTVWINKFISNLNIHVAPQTRRLLKPDTEHFLPVQDFISQSETMEEEAISEGTYLPTMLTEGGEYEQETDPHIESRT
ncbi:uncharacterized protein LOC119668917 [Teleopsis dalmanni]|uniref:uncharacterized protein LOC119668917 n=1 Tax=Teleopsis dalmanni TaxID=139649 RepID=UPI000D32AC2D|nr:uncharacterized protein LOC119668917 [Teleopsis dalmanni]